jgi:DNA-binding MarR family transcriptional regulator
MIEITAGTLEERIIKLLQKKYPITVSDIKEKLHVSRSIVMRVLKKFQIKGIVRLEPLPDKIYIRLLRRDFSFIGKRQQRKFIKHRSEVEKQKSKNYEGMMYS